MRWRRPLLTSTVTIALLIGACGGGTDATATTSEPALPDDNVPATEPRDATPSTESPGTTPAPASSIAGAKAETSPAGGGSCTITLSGDLQDQVTWDQDVTSVSSDYWLDEQQLRDSLEFLGDTETYEDYQGRGDPVLLWLQLSCAPPIAGEAGHDSSLGVLVASTDPTKGDQMPMAAGTYPVSGGIFDLMGPAGTVVAGLTISDDEAFGTMDGSGELEITTWDTQVIEGSVSFDVEEAFADQPRQASVRMDFSFRCLPEHHGVCG